MLTPVDPPFFRASTRGDGIMKRDPQHVGQTGADRSATTLVDAWLQALGGWRAETLGVIRGLIRQAAPEISEDCKWHKPSNPAGVPVWSEAGIVCTGEAYQDKVKLTFARGAALPDPTGIFNASLAGNARRAVDLREGDALDATAFKALIRAAVDENRRARAKRT